MKGREKCRCPRVMIRNTVNVWWLCLFGGEIGRSFNRDCQIEQTRAEGNRIKDTEKKG